MAGTRYDVRVRTMLGPALREYLAPRGEHTVTPKSTLVRFQVADDVDLIHLFDRLVENDLDVIAIRRLR